MERTAVKPKPQKLIKAYPITDNCQSLYERGEHAVIGISPFNSYFSLESIAALSNWAANNFKTFNLFIPDETSVYTLIALGYDEVKAIRKVKRQANYLKNKCLRALAELNLSGHEAEELILDFGYLNNNASYLSALEFYENQYASNIDFRRNCLEDSKKVLEAKINNICFEMLEIAVKYLIAELPVFFNSAAILEKKEAVFCYHNCSSLIQSIFKRKDNIVLKNQGYLVTEIESNCCE